MKKVFWFILLCITSVLLSVTHIVDIDGTGQYTSIQAGINAAVTGDTVLVYPGVYVENIDLSNKSITVGSLDLITGNPAYRDSTVIDGNQNGSTVQAGSSPVNSTLFGFTITNGSGVLYAQSIWGGGIFIKHITGEIRVSNCKITNNRASSGGGIGIFGGLLRLINTTIYNNYATGGGGLCISSPNASGNVIFDTQQRNSIYENYATTGSDIWANHTQSVINVVLDMFTLSYPDDYYVQYYNPDPNGVGSFTFDILRGYREEVNHDMYVSPNGNDNNSGFTPQEPLKTIAWALHKIAPDSLNPKTVYVAPGIYSTNDGQIFPLSMKSHCRLIGDSLNIPVMENLIFDGFIGAYKRRNCRISYLAFNGSGNMYYGFFGLQRTYNLELSNISVSNVNAFHTWSSHDVSDNIQYKNISYDDVTTSADVGFSGQIKHGSMENLTFNNCHSTGENTDGGMILETSVRDSLSMIKCSITNCTVNGLNPVIQINNYGSSTPRMNISNMLISNNSTPYIVANIFSNKYTTGTFSNNSIVNNTASGFVTELSGKWKVANSIFYNNQPMEINIPSTNTFPTIIDFSNNLIDNYPQSIAIGSPSIANFVQGNIDANPSFAGTDITDPMSYLLNYNSPCIDAGTPDTTGLYLPFADLYGNPRIYNGIIDIGCFEWNGTATQDNNIPAPNSNTLSIYPNPFRQHTNISYTLEKASDVVLEVFNTKGQRVKKLVNAKQAKGEQVMQWDGKDDNGKQVTSGIYFVHIQQGSLHRSHKMILVR